MIYHVRVKFNDLSEIDDEFIGAFINDNAEMFFLYQSFYDEKGRRFIERTSIKLDAVSEISIKPEV